ncbi:MAG: sugar phosphate isomerase/epimerase [Ardenticatenales bacterium]|nr:sugar phosphate isomerase/epimerase [Ardenticatenales bacterium]
MQLALAGHDFAPAQPLDEDIRLAAITGYPWLVVDHAKYQRFLAQPEFDIRDLKRLFLRTQPAAIDGLTLPDSDPAHAPQLEALCKEARRLGAPVLVLRIAQPDERIRELAEVAQRWSTVLALASPSFATVRALVQQANHDALGWYVDTVALWHAGEQLQPQDAARTVLLAVGDEDAQGKRCLPGVGSLPLAELLRPLLVGGYDGIAVLTTEPGLDENSARSGYEALQQQLKQIGWRVSRE